MSREEIDKFVESRIVSDDMHVYRSTDFEGFGRSLGYGKDKSASVEVVKAEENDEGKGGNQRPLNLKGEES